MAEIRRRRTIPVKIGSVWIGGEHPIAVQSMTNTDTADVDSTASQIESLAASGSEMVRITVNTREQPRLVPAIVQRLRDRKVTAPIIGDFHYNGHILLRDYPECARALDKYRINPGNVGMGRQHDDNFRTIIEIAVANDKAVRIGVNWGSLDQALVTQMMDDNARSEKPKSANEVVMDAMVASALESASLAQNYGMAANRIVLSAKVSGVQDLIDVYRILAARSEFALHLGLTEAGMGRRGVVSSTAALSVLLQEGIGDTIRVSPHAAAWRRSSRRSLYLPGRAAEPWHSQLFAPGDGLSGVRPNHQHRFSGNGVRHTGSSQRSNGGVADGISWNRTVESCRDGLRGEWTGRIQTRQHRNLTSGTGEEPKAPVYVDGRLMTTLKGPTIVGEFMTMLDQYVEQRYRRK
jgi:(E)-4-hydroxy-3-methylbut-2-enyl-diphosphate synthase